MTRVFYPQDHNATPNRVTSPREWSHGEKSAKGVETAVDIIHEFQRLTCNENVPGYFLSAVMKVGHDRDRSDSVSPRTPTTVCPTMVSDTSSVTGHSPEFITPKAMHDPFVVAAGTPTRSPRSSSGAMHKGGPILSGGTTVVASPSLSGNGGKSRDAKRSGRLLTAEEFDNFDYSVLDKFYKDSAGKYSGRHRESSASIHQSMGGAQVSTRGLE